MAAGRWPPGSKWSFPGLAGDVSRDHSSARLSPIPRPVPVGVGDCLLGRSAVTKFTKKQRIAPERNGSISSASNLWNYWNKLYSIRMFLGSTAEFPEVPKTNSVAITTPKSDSSLSSDVPY